MQQTITIRQLTAADRRPAEAAVKLLNRTQGRGLFDPTYLSARLANPESYVLAAFQEEELVGISVVEIIRDFSYYLPFAPLLAQELENKVVASFTTLSVFEPLQGRGIGQLLSQKRLAWAKERNCEVVLGVSWVSGLKHTSNRTFAAAGFHAVKQLTDFYHQSSLEKPFDCPGCHVLPCRCGAIFYRLDFPR